MRFWLRWAIVTLPVLSCIVLWTRSFWFDEGLVHIADNIAIALNSCAGSARVEILTYPANWSNTHGLRHVQQAREDTIWNMECWIGFGYEHHELPRGSRRLIEVPWWVVTLLAAIHPLWLYRRQRKTRKIGFPVEPDSANSKE